MPEPLVRCKNKVRAQMISRGMDPKKADDAARGICVKSTGMKFKRETFDERHILCEKVGEYSVGEDDRYIFLAGTALVPGVSLNFVNYLEKEIEKAYPTLENQKVNTNHDHFSPPIGKVVSSTLGKQKQVNYVIEVDTKVNPSATASLESGYIDHVSIEANPEWAECSICGRDYRECWKHDRGMKYKVDGKEELCTIIPHNFEFIGIAIVYNKEGVPAAQIAQTHQVPVFIEKMSEKVKRPMAENAITMKDVQKMLDEARKEYEEQAAQKVGVLEDQKSELQKQLEETQNKTAQLEKRERVRFAREIALLESKIMPKTYKEGNIDRREKELAEWSMKKLETRKEFLIEAGESLPKTKATKETIPSQKGGFINPPTSTPSTPEDIRNSVKFLEHKRIIEKAHGINKPLREDFVRYCQENDIVFKKDPKTRK